MTVRSAGRALLGMGFEPDAARFLAVVLLAGGVFTEGIVARWVGDDWGTGRTHHFFDGLRRLWKEKFPRDTGIVWRRVAGGAVYQCMGKGMYRGIGEKDSKFRRGFEPSDAAEVFRRVVRVSAVLRWCRWPWVLSGRAQLAAMEAVGLSRSVCPSRAYGKGAGAKRQVYFYDRPALVIQSDRCVLLHPFVEESPGGALVALQAYERERWVDTSYDEYDAFCDGRVVPLRPFYCDGAGYDLSGSRRVSSGHRESWTEYRWDPNPAETDPHYPWARLFWHDGGGQAGLVSGGVLMGDDGSGVCLIDRGFVRNSALPGPVPSVTGYVAGSWANYGGGTVRVECPEDDGSAGLTAAPVIAGAPTPAFDATVGVDFAPAIHEAAEAEAYTLEQYRSMRPCAEWPSEETPVPGVDCSVDLAPASPARLARLRASERLVSSGPSAGSISGFHVDSVAALMRHDWDVRRATGLSGRVDLDTAWSGGGDVGSGVAEAARSFGPGAGWRDCGRRDYLMGSGADSLWGAWVARAQTGRAAEMAASGRLLGLASGLDPSTTVNCRSNGVCTADDAGFVASHDAIFAEAEVLYRDVEANPDRVCGIGDQVSPPGP